MSCATSRPATRPVSASQGPLVTAVCSKWGGPPIFDGSRRGAAKEEQSIFLSHRARPGSRRLGPSLRHKLVPSDKPQFPHLDSGGQVTLTLRTEWGAAGSGGAMPMLLLTAAFVPGFVLTVSLGTSLLPTQGTRMSLCCSA